jgi:signal transduction histidine kinase
MGMRPPVGLGKPNAEFGATHPLRPVLRAGLLTLILFSTSASIIYLAFKPVTPPAVMAPLSVFVFLYVLTWIVVVAVMIARRPDPVEEVRVWGIVTLGLIFACQIICVWLTWVVMPFGSMTLQYMAAAIILTNSPSQIIASPESIVANRIGTVVVNGSLALYLLSQGQTLAAELAVYVAGFGALMFILSGTIGRTVQATVRQRMASESEARMLEELLAVAAAERDAKTRFISAASHDLGQPLQAAALFFDQTVRASDEGGRLKAADGVRRALSAAEQLLSHMLNHLRLEADAVVPHLSRMHARQVMARVASQYTPLAQTAGIEIRTGGRDLDLLVDPALIDRALGNLVHNAIMHSRGTRILVGARRFGPDAVRLWIIDNGAGVGLTEAKHIFEDYYQGPTPIDRPRSGFGLGLSSVKRIAELCHGRCGLDPRWVKGAAFYIELPVAGAPPAAAMAVRAAPVGARHE